MSSELVWAICVLMWHDHGQRLAIMVNTGSVTRGQPGWYGRVKCEAILTA